jgi:hypothetical protein
MGSSAGPPPSAPPKNVAQAVATTAVEAAKARPRQETSGRRMRRILPAAPKRRNLPRGVHGEPAGATMSVKSLVKLALVAAVLFSGVQFSKVYVHKTQLKKIIGDEALDARHNKNMSAEVLKGQIQQRLESEQFAVTQFDDLEITGLGDPKADVVVTARYQEVVDLLVHKHVMNVVVTGRADAP